MVQGRHVECDGLKNNIQRKLGKFRALKETKESHAEDRRKPESATDTQEKEMEMVREREKILE